MTTGPAAFLVMRGISKRYGGTQALRDVAFAVARGEVHALVGENGAGKSTLVKVLTGAVRADAGEIALAGVPARIDSPSEARRLGIRVVHQHVTLVPHLGVAENVVLGRWPSGRLPGWIDWAAAEREARRVLDEIGAAHLPLREPVARLGLAQRKLVEIAKALVVRPHVLVMDEPTAALSRDDRGRLLGVVRRLRAEGIAVVYISHDLDEVFEVADRITVLRDGAVVGTVQPGATQPQRLVEMMVGREIGAIAPPGERTPGAEALVVRHLTAPGRFEDVSLSVAGGEIVGLYGLVGSGRTELARCIFGADPFAAGEMRLDGRPFRPRSPRDARRAGVAMVTEDRLRDGLVPFLSVLDNVSLPNAELLSRLGVLRRRRQRAVVEAKVHELNVRPRDIDRQVSTLSGGNQQKVVLAKWLLTRARVLILDEPTAGVDIAAKAEIHRIVADLAAGGMAILLVSSDLPAVLGLSDRVLVMRKGRLAGEYSRGAASQEALLARATGV